MSIKIEDASESLSYHQRASAQENATLENSPARLGQFREIAEIAERVRLSAQSLGEATVLAAKDNLIQYRDGDQLMQSLCMSSLSQDYTLDGEGQDQRETTLGCTKTKLGGNIRREAGTFEKANEKSESRGYT